MTNMDSLTHLQLSRLATLMLFLVIRLPFLVSSGTTPLLVKEKIYLKEMTLLYIVQVEIHIVINTIKYTSLALRILTDDSRLSMEELMQCHLHIYNNINISF